ncbi:MAG: sigma-54 dependent transcriptional regulator [Candidatus Omnitrophica bacterium]|nr:sigma-54 dependent transcriptional regulator [Candidatus Omnitrophota bacterium]
MGARILVIDDQIQTYRESLEEILDAYELIFAESGPEGMLLLERTPVAVVLLDVRMPAAVAAGPELEGIAVLRRIKQTFPALPVIMLTVSSEIEIVVEAIKQGAFHYLQKPPDRAKLTDMIERALENARLKEEVDHLKRVVQLRDSLDAAPALQADRDSYGTLTGKSSLMRALYEKIEKIAPVNAAVIIRGPTGCGKELVARELHRRSGRRGNFVPVNCAAIPADLLESELFGHEKGAFTDAHTRKPGIFEQAHAGTVFLDEIADMPLPLQAKLLRVLQDKKVTPVGARQAIQVDTRILSATNKPLDDLISAGVFREDLYYRLNVICLDVPALNRRAEDIPLLVDQFIRKYCREFNTPIRQAPPELLARLQAYRWPGNVRELESAVQKLIALSDGEVLSAAHLSLPENPEEPAPKLAAQLWEDILNQRARITDLTAFRNKYGSQVLERLLSRAIEHTHDVKSAGVLLGYIPAADHGEKYANFRQWLNRLGISKKSILKDTAR